MRNILETVKIRFKNRIQVIKINGVSVRYYIRSTS